MGRRRSLHPEEQDLWHAVARTATPMHAPLLLRRAPDPSVEPLASPALKHAKPRLPAFTIGERAKSTQTAAPVPASIQMDAKAFTKMTRGKLVPEARIDLHGLTLAEAHPELIHFILNAQSAGLRLVLVITGKGRINDAFSPAPVQRGVLRQQVPHWLRQPPMGPTILQVTEAHLRHGGSGAFYVYLRRSR